MKNKLFSFGCCLVMLLTTFFTSCKQEVPVPEMVTISYVSEYGTLDKTEKIVEKGYKLKADDFPKLTEEGYTFDKWYINKVEAKVDTVIDKDSVLVAKWIKVLDTTEPGEATFGEITANDGKALVTWTNPKDKDFNGVILSMEPAVGTLEKPVMLGKDAESFKVDGLSNDKEYTFKLITFDNSSNKSTGVTKKATPSDTRDKDAPNETTLTVVSAKDGVVELSWTKTINNDLKGYELSSEPASGTLINPVTLNKDTLKFTVSGLVCNNSYTFKIKTFDESLNYSKGATITATPIDTSDKTAPKEVTDCIATKLDGAVALRWTDPSDTDLFGIEITYTPKSTILTRSIAQMVEGSIFVAPNTQYVAITKLTNDKEYIFTLKTMDLSGNKSDGVTVKCTPHLYKIGDILLSNGDSIAYGSYKKQDGINPIAVVCGFNKYGAPLGLGLKQSKNALKWAAFNTIGYNTTFTDIVCTPSAYDGQGTADKATFTGDLDGSDNWDEICKVDKEGTKDAATNYPAFNWVNTYGTTYNLPDGYKDGWYMPSIYELTEYIYKNRDVLNQALTKLGETIAIPLTISSDYCYWSSSQRNLSRYQSWILYFENAFLESYKRDGDYCWVRSVRAF